MKTEIISNEGTPTEVSDEEYEVVEKTEILRKGATFEEVRDLAMQNRKTHPNEPVEWQLDSNHNTYTLRRVIVDGK